MIDLKTLEFEVHQARAARLDAEAAGSEVEALIWSVQHFQPGRQRLLFMVAGGEPELGTSGNGRPQTESWGVAATSPG